MPAKIQCRQCQTEFVSTDPNMPCPACLIRLGMASWQANSLDDADMTRTFAGTGSPSVDIPDIPLEQLRKLFPQLQIEGMVGRGGMGAVYRAQQISLQRTVALKVIRPDVNAKPGFAERFVREARALAQLSHPNIVTVHDFGQVEGMYYLLMEYIEGTNLRELMRTKQLAPRQAMEIVPAICDALQFAHDNGIVHRDIKPENILVSADGRVKIADFGLAKLLHPDPATTHLTGTDHVMGTLHYMAPEQLERPTEVDHRADIYSLGVVIYEMLTGELPLGRFAAPSQKVQIDVRLDEIVLHTLEKEPSLRYQRASELKTDVQSVASQYQLPPQPPVKPSQPVADEKLKFGLFPDVPIGLHSGKQPKSVEPKMALGPVRVPSIWLSIPYLLASLPAAIIYLVVLSVGFSLGLGTIILLGIGFLILLGTMLFARSAARLEGAIAGYLCGRPIDFACKPLRQTHWEEWRSLSLTGLMRPFLSACTDFSTWRAVSYLLLKFPLSVIGFSVGIALFDLAVKFSLAPFLYQYSWYQSDFQRKIWYVNRFDESLLAMLLGLVLLVATYHLLPRLAWLHCKLAQLILEDRR